MKKLTIIVGTLFLMSTCILVSNPLWAKETSHEEVEQGFKEVGKAVAEKMREKQTDTETPFMGVYLDDLDFEDAYEMHYDYNYGVLLDGVVKGGPADKAGLMEEDIIMEFDGVKARYEDRLRSLIKSKHVG
ncbi:MAG: PDZ domain-containing protein, partial [Candidatus Cloacimonetes bacterium]|nr:PDZ domain-containing protein [Candidatus Cloacimonadota bacterium]